MKYKKIMLILITAIFLVSIASVCAADANDTMVASENTNQMELSSNDVIVEDNLKTCEDDTVMEVTDEISKTVEDNKQVINTTNNEEMLSASNDEVLGVENELDVLGTTGTFSDLRNEIGDGGNKKLQRTYYSYDHLDAEPITINTAGVIDGNGAIIDMSGSEEMSTFVVNVWGVTIKNLTIKNAAYLRDSGHARGAAIHFIGSGTVINCNFTGNRVGFNFFCEGGAICFDSYTNGEVINCNFEGNQVTSSLFGGAICFEGGSTGTVTNCNFVGNYAQYGGAIYSNDDLAVTADTCIFKAGCDTTDGVRILPPTMNVDDFITFYNSSEKLTFNLTTNSGMLVDNGNISISVYNKDNGAWIGNYNCLSGEGWIPDLQVGSYYAIFNTEYAGFQPVNRSITITMPAGKYYVNVTSVTTNNKTVNVTAKTNVPNDIIWEGKLLFILPNGTKISANYTADGIWWAVHTFDDYTDYQVNASYIGLSNVAISNATIIITRTNSTVNVSDVVLDYGESTNVTVTAEGAIGITAKINDTNVTIVNNFTIPISGLAAGNYTLTVTTIPDGDHNPVTKTVNITVNKAGTEITLTNETLYLKAGDIVSGLANLTPGDAGNLTFQSSNDDIAIASDGTILARVKGNVTVTVSFAGTDNYAPAENKTITVYVALKDASVSVENETLNLNVNEKYEFNPTVNPSFLAVQYSSSNESVAVVTDYGLLRAVGEGTAIITLTVGNNQTYAINTTNVTVTVSLNDASVSLNNSTLDLFVGDTFTIVATTTPAGLNVTYVQDDSGVYTVDSNGVVTALKTGTGNILVKVGGDGVYVENSTEIPVIVSKAPTEIAADPIAATYNANKDLVITLKDSRGKPLSGLNITVDFNGAKNYTTDTSGQVKISTKGLAANIYDVGIFFNGTDNYVNCSNTTKVSIYKESSRADTKPLTTDYNVHKYLVVGLKDNEGNPIRNADAFIEIHGVTYKCRSDDAGDARLIIRLNPGTYTAKITFDNVNYTGFTQYVTVIVKKITPKLTAKKKTFKKSKKVKKYTVTLKANSKALAKVKLTLKVKGKTYKAKTNSKGKATFKIKNLKKKGTFKAKVKFAGNAYYNAVTKTVKIKIK